MLEPYGKNTLKILYLTLIAISLLLCRISNADPVIGEGGGDFVFEHKVGEKVKHIKVYYYAPKELTKNSRIAFVLHGAGRKAEGYRDEWIQYAKKYNFIVLCPEFSEQDFPGWYAYNGGYIYNYKEKKYSPKEEWAFHVIERLFDFVKEDRKMRVDSYGIFGHSAGAQFVQRMVLFMPEARFSVAIANGAGDYTHPTFDRLFSGGLGNTIATKQTVKKAFSKELIILMGSKDLMSKTMPKSEEQMHKWDRVWRAKIFYKDAKEEAEKLGAEFNWRFQFVPNADHNNPKHALFGSRYIARSKKNIKRPEKSDDPNESSQD
jgi:hypothetical protein